MIDPTKIVARFYAEAIQNQVKTLEANRPIFDEIELCELRIPGNTKQIVVQMAHEVANFASDEGPEVTYAMLFNKQYQMFKAGHESQTSGTPLDELSSLTLARKRELMAIGIPTVEALAAVNDSNLKKIGSEGRTYREQAQAYLDAAKGNAPMAVMAARLAELESLLAAKNAPMVIASDVPQNGGDFGDLTDDDIKGMIKDAGGDVPRGAAKRETLLAALRAAA